MMYIDNYNLMVAKFESVMAKLAVLGQNSRNVVDCSEVIPATSAANAQVARLPARKTLKDIEHSVRFR